MASCLVVAVCSSIFMPLRSPIYRSSLFYLWVNHSSMLYVNCTVHNHLHVHKDMWFDLHLCLDNVIYRCRSSFCSNVGCLWLLLFQSSWPCLTRILPYMAGEEIWSTPFPWTLAAWKHWSGQLSTTPSNHTDPVKPETFSLSLLLFCVVHM